MLNLSKTELTILSRCQLIQSTEISKEEYETLYKSNPNLVYFDHTPKTYYKYVLPDSLTEKTLERMEQAEILNALYNNNNELEIANDELSEIKEQLNEKLGAIQYCVTVMKKIMVAVVTVCVIAALFSIIMFINSFR